MPESEIASPDTQSSGTKSRRDFLRFASAAAAAVPIVTEAALARAAAKDDPVLTGMALHGQGKDLPPADAVLINANENPLGPCKTALQGIVDIAPMGGRYDLLGEEAQLKAVFAAQNGLKEENIEIYAGSSEPLHYSVLAFTSPTKSLVTADVAYEAPWAAAMTSGAKVAKVALTADYAHDVKALVAAAKANDAGVIYICNPNNPTGTITPKADIAWALENKPKGSILLVDEAYIHLSDAEPALDYVAQGKDLIVLRTFSKIYGMAGIRCGFAVGRPDLLAKLKPFGQNAMPVTGLTAAKHSLLDANLVPLRKKMIGDTRRDTIAWLKANGFKVLGDSQTNCFMIETGRRGKEVFEAMKARKVYIGRSWAALPTAVRVSVGTPEEMAKFKVAWKDVMSAPAKTADLSVDAHTQFPRYS
ncbi:MAG: pyridoxal phosphate-dependent aminotransferase [Caulobacteraceae bacterium]